MQSPRRQAPGSGQRAQFRAGQVVWAKCRGYPWWPARVQRPTAAEKKKTGWHNGQVYVRYFGTKQIQALGKESIQRWYEKPVPVTLRPDSRKAVQEAVKAVSRGARV
ncbi:hypothetical protein ABBQ32_007954 [Trebouxia sp. C0010 RCD-2024]